MRARFGTALTGWRRVHPANVADQAVQFVRDLGEVLVGSAAELGAFGFQSCDTFQVLLDVHDSFAVLAQHRGLALLDLSDHNQCVLKILDGPFNVGHKTWCNTTLTILACHEKMRSCADFSRLSYYYRWHWPPRTARS